MTESKLLVKAVTDTIENNPTLVEKYNKGIHGALNDLLAKLNENMDDCISNEAAISEFRRQLN